MDLIQAIDNEENDWIEIKPCSKEDNYPSWMRELMQKTTEVGQNLQEVRSQIQMVEDGLKQVDIKELQLHKLRHAKTTVLPQKSESILNYHEQYQSKMFIRNSKMNNQKINHYLFLKIQQFLPNAVQSNLIMSRVCRQWNHVCNNPIVWKILFQQTLGVKIIELNTQLDDYKEVTTMVWREFTRMIKFFNFNTSKDIFSQQMTRECLKSLRIIQQVLSIPQTCWIQQELVKFSKSNEFKCGIEVMMQNNNDMIKQQAIGVFLTISKVSEYQYKRIVLTDQLSQLKKKFNDNYPENPFFPANIHIDIENESNKQIYIYLRDVQKLQKQIRSFQTKYRKAELNISHSGSAEIYFIELKFEQNMISMKQLNNNDEIYVNGTFKFIDVMLHNTYGIGLQDFGQGVMHITTLESRSSYDIYLCMDDIGDFYVIGLSKYQEYLIIKFI